ncbi:hypothetical protein [Mesorhizobium shangrilense]|uniref:Uncharacterized protein n=1 Tax=Mesorhizobium shangrilense TaxID=460060 RepID=A0ABV2D729_9HYPH
MNELSLLTNTPLGAIGGSIGPIGADGIYRMAPTPDRHNSNESVVTNATGSIERPWTIWQHNRYATINRFTWRGSFSASDGVGERVHLFAVAGSSANEDGAAQLLNTQYQAVAAALQDMVEAGEDESHFIDQPTFQQSVNFVNYLRLFDVPAPKVFAHGGDAITFVWAIPDRKRYVTLDEDGATFLEMIKRSGVTCEAEAYIERKDFSTLISVLGGKAWQNRASV